MMERSSKERVLHLFEGKETGQAPFIPWVCGFAARLEQIPIEDMLSDAGLLSKALVNARQLFGCDAIISVFDPTLEAEACGCSPEWGDGTMPPEISEHPFSEASALRELDTTDITTRGRIPIVLDSTKRIIQTQGREIAVLGTVTGPLTLAWNLRGDRFFNDIATDSRETGQILSPAGDILLRMCRAYCELGVDGIVIAESVLGQVPPENIGIVEGIFRSIRNVAGYYGAHTIILAKDCVQGHIGPALSLETSGAVISGAFDERLVAQAAGGRTLRTGRVIPTAALSEPPDRMRERIATLLAGETGGGFLTTEWEVPAGTDVNTMHAITDAIAEHY